MSSNRNLFGRDSVALSAVPPSAMSHIGAQRAFAEKGIKMESGGVSAASMVKILGALGSRPLPLESGLYEPRLQRNFKGTGSMAGECVDSRSISDGLPEPVEVVLIGDFLDDGKSVVGYPTVPLPKELAGHRVMVLPDIHIADLDTRRTRSAIGQMREDLEAIVCGTTGNRQERRKNRSGRRKK